jgi:hypothetical protein
MGERARQCHTGCKNGLAEFDRWLACYQSSLNWQKSKPKRRLVKGLEYKNRKAGRYAGARIGHEGARNFKWTGLATDGRITMGEIANCLIWKSRRPGEITAIDFRFFTFGPK